MNFGKLLAPAVSLALLAAAGQPAFAQAAAVTVGGTVKDAAGGDVGTITAVNGTTVTLKTDKHEVQLPAASFGARKNGYVISLTRDQLNAQVEQAMAAAQASLQPGVTVSGAGGTVVGTIEAIDDQFATLKLTSGKLVKVPRSGIAPGSNGAVLGLSAAELSAAAAAGPASPPAS